MTKLEEAYQLYFNKVYRFLLSLSGSSHLAEDLTQETFLKAFLNQQTYRETGNMSAWLCTIAKNLWLNECRRHKYEAELDTDLPDPSASPESALAEKEQRRKLRNAIMELPEDYRDIVLLHIYSDVTLKEIAASKGKSESWGKVTYYRAKQMLVRKLEESK